MDCLNGADWGSHQGAVQFLQGRLRLYQVVSFDLVRGTMWTVAAKANEQPTG
jgi:hypothetical protein